MAFTVETPASRITVNADSAAIGHDRSCQIKVSNEQSIQPIHATIKKIAGRWLVEANGDWLIQVGDGVAGRKNWLKPGDVIRLTEAGPELIFEPPVATSSPNIKMSASQPPPLPTQAPPALPTKPTKPQPLPASNVTTEPPLPISTSARGLLPAKPTSEGTARPSQRDEFVAATEEVLPALRRPSARPNKTKLFLILGGGGVLTLIVVVAVVALTSGRKTTPSNGPDVTKTDSGNRAEPVSRNGVAKAAPTLDVKVDLPDFSKVDYSLDTSKLDYTKGPKGESLIRRKTETLDWQGYKDRESGEMLQHGQNAVLIVAGTFDKPLPSVKTMESFYFAGKQHGTIKTWYQSGEKESSGLMKDHVKHGKWQFWHKNGKLKQEEHWLTGKQHGSETTWFESGQKEYERTFVNDDRQGPSYSWWPNGKKGSEVSFKSDVRHGPATWWDEKGKLILRLQYRDGKTSYDPATGTVNDFAEAKSAILEELGKDREKLEVILDIFGQPQAGYTPLPNNKYQDQSWIYRCSDGDAVVKCVVFREDTRIPQTVRIISIKKR